jgi:ribonuclease HI
LEAIPHGLPATVHSDSQYVVKGMPEWLPGWKKRGWRTGDKKPVSERHVQWIWARGHAGHEQNERVDGLANAEARRAAEEMTL